MDENDRNLKMLVILAKRNLQFEVENYFNVETCTMYISMGNKNLKIYQE